MEEISEDDSFTDGIESVKGDIEQTEGSVGAEIIKLTRLIEND